MPRRETWIGGGVGDPFVLMLAMCCAVVRSDVSFKVAGRRGLALKPRRKTCAAVDESRRNTFRHVPISRRAAARWAVSQPRRAPFRRYSPPKGSPEPLNECACRSRVLQNLHCPLMVCPFPLLNRLPGITLNLHSDWPESDWQEACARLHDDARLATKPSHLLLVWQ